MKLGRFIVDTHVHAQRFAAGKKLGKGGEGMGQPRVARS
jgi:hypothetical protein